MSVIIAVCIIIIGFFILLTGLAFYLRFINLTPIYQKGKNWAVFYDDTGFFSHIQKIKYFDKTFTSQERSYIFDPLNSSFFTFKALWRTHKFYSYNIGDPHPLILNKNRDAVIDPKTLEVLFKNNLIQQLNDLNNGFIKFITKYWWLILIIIAIIIYFSTGHKLPFNSVTPQVIDNSTQVTAVRIN